MMTLSRLALTLVLTSLPLAAVAQIEEEDIQDTAPSPEPGTVSPDRPSFPEPAIASNAGRVRELEALAEQKYLEGDLEIAAELYVDLAEEVTEPDRKIGYLISSAWLESQRSEPEAARQILMRALAIDPRYDFPAQNYSQEFVNLYQTAAAEIRSQLEARARDLIRSAVLELQAGRLPLARGRLQEALTLAPNHPVALYNLGLVEAQAGHRDEAIGSLEKLLALGASQPDTMEPELRARTLATLGLLYYEKEFLEDARTHLAEAVRIDPQSSHAWNNLGLTLRRLGRDTEARDAFRRAVELAPDDPNVISNLAVSYISSERWSEAVALLTDATRRNPGDGFAWLNLALAQRGLGNLDGARGSLQQVMALDPANQASLAARAASYLALIEHQADRFPEAAAAATRAVEWNPADVDAWVYLGLAQQASGNVEAAKTSFQTAANLDPARAEIHNNLGTALMNLDDTEGARAAFRQALAIRPDFAEAQANLSQLDARTVAQTTPTSTSRREDKKRERRRRYPRPLGAEFDPIPYSYLGEKGALVVRVQIDGPAGRAGMRKGDVVMGLDGKEIDTGQEILQYLYHEAENEIVLFDILRDGKPKRLRVRIF